MIIRPPEFFTSTFMPAQVSVLNFLESCEETMFRTVRENPDLGVPADSDNFYEVDSKTEYRVLAPVMEPGYHDLQHLASRFASGDAKYGIDNFVLNISGVGGDMKALPEPVRKAMIYARRYERKGDILKSIAVLYDLINCIRSYSRFAVECFATACHELGIQTYLGMEEKDYVHKLTMAELADVSRQKALKDVEAHEKKRREEWQRINEKRRATSQPVEVERSIDLPGDFSLDVKSTVGKETLHVEIVSWTYLSDEEYDGYSVGEFGFNYDSVPRPKISFGGKQLSWVEEEAHDGGGVSFFYELDIPREKDGDGIHELAVEMPDGTEHSFTVDEAAAIKNSAK